MNTTAANAAAAARPPIDVEEEARRYVLDGSVWLGDHWLEILIAAGIGTGIVLLLFSLRSLGKKLCERDPRHTGWPTIIGRAVSRTGSFFIIMLSARLVSTYTDPPEGVVRTIAFLWTVAAVFQAAIWLRELVLGTIEHRTSSARYQGESLANALGIIRLLVTVVLFSPISSTVPDDVP